MKKVKVYNIKDHIEFLTINEEKYTTVGVFKLAIIEGKDKVIIIKDEGCGAVYNKEEKYGIDIAKVKDVESTVYFKADETYTIPITDMISKIPYQEMLLSEFIDESWHWKPRIHDNFLEVLDAINKIGLRHGEYCPKKYVNENFKTHY